MHFSDDWLREQNEEFRANDIPLKQRPFQALAALSKLWKREIDLSSPEARRVFHWFEANSKPGAHIIGSLFQGAFFYDTCFWRLHVPVTFGRVRLNPLDSITEMPTHLRHAMEQNSEAMRSFLPYWADCVDYAHGWDRIRKAPTLDPKAVTFIENGHLDMVGASSQLTVERPNTKAILNLRMACEIFLKAFLIQERKLTEQQLKKLGHKIEDIAKECFTVQALQDFQHIERHASLFPEVSTRYDGNEPMPLDAWKAVCLTQLAAATVIRRYSGIDNRSQILMQMP